MRISLFDRVRFKRLITLTSFLLCFFWAYANTYIVTSNSDNGTGTLREALEKCALDWTETQRDTILFDLPDVSEAGRTINLLTELPEVTSMIYIDATSQKGTQFGISNAKVILQPAQGVNVYDGLLIKGNHSEIYGFYIRDFSNGGITIASAFWLQIGKPGKGNVICGVPMGIHKLLDYTNAENISIQSNIIGLEPDGKSVRTYADPYRQAKGIYLIYSKTPVIGGDFAEEGNLIAGYTKENIFIAEMTDVKIANNKIGVSYDGSMEIIGPFEDATKYDVLVDYSTPTITHNLIRRGLYVSATYSNGWITGNTFGTDLSKSKRLRGKGVFIDGLSNANNESITIDSNIFAYDAFLDVKAFPVSIRRNSFYCQGSPGIRLNLPPAAEKPFVTVTSYSSNTISGTSLPNSVIELFYDDNCNGCNGKTLIDFVRADNTGKWSYTSIADFNDAVVVTATAPSRATSEFSTCSKIETVTSSNSCNNSTFFMRIPAPAGEKIELKKIQTLPNTDFVVAGNLIFQDNHREGMIVRMANNGMISDQKTIRIDDKPTTIHDAKALTNGSVFISGSIDDGNNTIFAALLNKDLTVNSIRKLKINAPPQKLTADIIDVYGPVLFAVGVQLNNAALVIVLNNDLSVKWTSQVDLPGLTDVVGFSMYTYAPLALISNCIINGKKNILITELSDNAGLVNVTRMIEDGTWESMGLAASSYSASIKLLGVRKNASNQFEVFRNNIVSSSNLEFRHRYTVSDPTDFSVSGALDNAADAMAISFPSTGKLLFIKQFAYYQTTTEHVREYDVPVGSAIRSVSRSYDGGYLFGLNKNDQGEIILIKTDSTGILPGCGYTDASANFTEEIQQPLYPASSTATAVNNSIVNSTHSFTNLDLKPAFNCKENYCPAAPPEDTCLSSYVKLLKSNSYSDGFSQYYLMRNKVHLVNTRRLDRVVGSFNTETHGLKLFDEKGNYIKGVSVWMDSVAAIYGIKKMTDSTFLLQSYAPINNIPTYTFTLMNDNLQPVWSTSIRMYTGFEFTNNSVFLSMHRDAIEGSYFFAGISNGFMQPAGVMAIKLDANGNFLWQKAYKFNASSLIMAGLTSTPSSLIIVAEGNPNSFSVRLDKATGAVFNGYSFATLSDGGLAEPLFSFDNDRIIYASKRQNSDFVMGIFDTLGKPGLIKTIPNSSIPRASILSGDKLYVSYNYFNGSSYKDVLLKIDTALNLEFFNESDFTLYGYPSGIGIADNGSIYMGGNYSKEQYFDPFIKKYEPDGKLGTCGFTATAPNLVTIDGAPTNLTFTPVQKTIQPVSLPPLKFVADTNGQTVSAIVCSSTPQCNLLKLSGPTSVCQLNTTYNFTITKTAGCSILPECFIDTASIRIKKLTDTSVMLEFKKAGMHWIKMKLDAGCSEYWDSLQVAVSDATARLDLGNDTSLCEGNILLLNAKKGFLSYLWQDNSADSTFLVNVPGTYWVTVSDACSNSWHDTVVVSKEPPIAFTPLQDRWKCNNDTVQLAASSGFIHYSWWPAYNASSTTQQTITVNPQTDTAYYLTAEKKPGCFIHDTVLVHVNHSPAINLGKDTSFCQGQQIVLDAGGGFTGYAWNTGAVNEQIAVTRAGNYIVTASTAEGCSSTDSLEVVNVFANPIVSLDKNPGLCIGTTRVLDAGNFSKYLWQDGSTNRKYTVSGTGVYYVQVTDNNHCTGSDTTVITNLYDLPANFLPSDTSLCTYELMQLKPTTGFQRYNWSNGSTASFIQINNAGNYWLQVTDKNNCTGRDSITVYTKECMVGVYVPTAFTPNGDTHNDVFRAMAFGKIKSFEFIIYNRWGQIIFRTNDRFKGWDGKLAGVEQRSDVYIWTCRYQFEGEQEQFKKGTVTLVR